MDEELKLPTQEELLNDEREFLADDRWMEVDIGPNILDVTAQYQRPMFSLSYRGTPFAPLGGIHALTGQPGNGKTMTFTQLMVAILKGEYGELRYELGDALPKPRILYVDTEQEKGNTQLVNLRVYQMMGWSFGVPHDEFLLLWLREEEKAVDRWRKTLKGIWELRPDVVFLDGLLDVIGDFNDNVECQDVIYKCMKVASHYNISVWCLVHENPGSTKMVGHVGSILERKVTDILETKKVKEGGSVHFNVTQKKARGKDLEDLRFVIEDGGLGFGIPVQDSSGAGEPSPNLASAEGERGTVYPELLTMEELMQMQSLITSHNGLSTREMREAVKSTYGVGAGKADRIMERGVELRVIARGDNKRYYLPDKTGEQGACPF